MSFERVNDLHTAVLENATEMDQLTVTYRNALKAITEIEDKRDTLWQHWSQHVIDTGRALSESQQQHGTGWERAYSSLGFALSYPVACQYIACATHPDAGEYTSSIDEWAEAAVGYEQPTNLVNNRQAVATGVSSQMGNSSGLADQPSCDNYDCLDYDVGLMPGRANG